MELKRNKRASKRRQGIVVIVSSGFMLLALVFSISLASTRPETSVRQQPAVAATSAETEVQSIAPEQVRPEVVWTGKAREDITQRRLPGHSECDLQLD
ncbi:MAG TPA: hypothetical protein VK416_13820 [Thermoanaerobaculia bacterium]|nr:hypothetical protein [Thermoanaerobaculia bacterium]